MARVKGAAPAARLAPKVSSSASVLNTSSSSRLNQRRFVGPSSCVSGSRSPAGRVTRGYWGGLAHKFGSPLSEGYLSAVETIVSLSSLSSVDFCKVSKKITTLIELARKTLLDAGIQLYEFSRCTPSYVEYKVAYFRLLRFLKQRRGEIDESLNDRVQRLLLPLSPSFARIVKGRSGAAGLGALLPRGSNKASKRPRPQFAAGSGDSVPPRNTSSSNSHHPNLMPPPLVHWRLAAKTTSAPNKGPLSQEANEVSANVLPKLKRKRKGGAAPGGPYKRQRSNADAAFDYFDKLSRTRGPPGFRVVQGPPSPVRESRLPIVEENDQGGAGNSDFPMIIGDVDMSPCYTTNGADALDEVDKIMLDMSSGYHLPDVSSCPPVTPNLSDAMRASFGLEPFPLSSSPPPEIPSGHQQHQSPLVASGNRSVSKTRADSPIVEPALGWTPNSAPPSRRGTASESASASSASLKHSLKSKCTSDSSVTEPLPAISEESADAAAETNLDYRDMRFSPTRGCFGIFGGKPRPRLFNAPHRPRPISATPSR